MTGDTASPCAGGRLPLEPRFWMAPMAGVSDYPFRDRLRRNGCRKLFTEMVSAAALARGNPRTQRYLQDPDRGADLAIQLFGAVPGELAAAAERACAAGFAHIDLNMGCPVRKVVRSGAGAALMADPDLAARCLRALRGVVPGHLSVKIRSGWDDGSKNASEIALLAEDCGVDSVVLHPRTRAQMYAGRADWSLVAEVAARLRIPVVGNGDIDCGSTAVARLRETGCAAVMIGRAALSSPWLFRVAEGLWRGDEAVPAPDVPAQGGALLRQLTLLVEHKSERAAVTEMRKFLAWGTKGLHGAIPFRRRVQTIDRVEAMAAEIRGFFCGVGASAGGGE